MTKAKKNPIYKTDGDTMEKLAGAYPIVETIIAYRKVSKATTTYFYKLKKLVERNIKPRFQFNMYAAPTFRFSAPGGNPDKDGACGINIQAVSEGEERDMTGVKIYAHGQLPSAMNFKLLESEDLLVEPGPKVPAFEMIPWKAFYEKVKTLPYVMRDNEGTLVCIREKCEGCSVSCEGQGIDVTRTKVPNVDVIPGVRQAFKAPEGYTLLSADYDRQEVVIGANLSGEPKWLDALERKADIHALTAAEAFSIPDWEALPASEKKKKRPVGKLLVFSIFYGANEYTVARKTNLVLAVAKQIFDNFKNGLPTLNAWMQKVQRFARKNGYTTTYFGRKRYLDRFYKMDDRKMHSFADRSSVNTAVQGTGADITRIAMVKVTNMFKEQGYSKDQVRILIQIHDELMFLVRNDVLKEIAPKIRKTMMFYVKGWRVQLTVGLKTGTIWGEWEELKVED